MYSILPALVAALFLACGLYVAVDRGRSRVTDAFLLLCLTTAVWQGTWAVLFQTEDAAVASVLVRVGYLFILFLPTALYQFLAEIAEVRSERRWVGVSYGVAGLLALTLVTTDRSPGGGLVRSRRSSHPLFYITHILESDTDAENRSCRCFPKA